MSKIAILTDSSCDIPQEMAEKYGIDIMSFHILLDDVDYVERVDCTNTEFYDKMRAAKGVPSTAAITPIQFCEKYCQYVDEGYTDVIHVPINKSGSSTYNNALMAQGMLREERPEHHLNIHLLDPHTYSMVFGWYLCEMARKLQNGAEIRHVIHEFEQQMNCMEVVLGPYSLRQMKKSGRISAAAAVMGELMGIRPIITLIDGKTKVEAKVRGDEKVVPAMVDLCQKRAGDVEDFEYMIDHVFNNRMAILSDNVAGTKALVQQAWACGHRRIAFIHGEKTAVTESRLAGFYQACEELGLKVPEEYVRCGVYHDVDRCAEETRALLALPQRPTCIIFPDDFSALGGYNALTEAGLSIPEDISVMGYDGIYLSRVVKPSLVTYQQNTKSLGRLAADKLIELIEHPRVTLPEQIRVSGKLLDGGSVRIL